MSTILTPNLQLQNIVTGTQPTTWWNTSNFDRTLMDEAVAGVTVFPVTGDMTITAAVSGGSARVWEFTGTPSAPATITYAPNTSKNWVFVINNSSQVLTFTQGMGTTLPVDPVISAILMFDGIGAGANCTQFAFTNAFLPGSVAAPGITFLGFPDVGLYCSGGPGVSHLLGVASDGVTMVSFAHSNPSFASLTGLNTWGQFA